MIIFVGANLSSMIFLAFSSGSYPSKAGGRPIKSSLASSYLRG